MYFLNNSDNLIIEKTEENNKNNIQVKGKY